MSKFTTTTFVLLVTTITSFLSHQAATTQLESIKKDAARLYSPISGTDRAELIGNLLSAGGQRDSNNNDYNTNDNRGFHMLEVVNNQGKASVDTASVVNGDDLKGNIDVIGASSRPKLSRPAQSISAIGHQQAEADVHETNKLILLTDGQHIKLFPLVQPNLSSLALSGGHYVIKSAGFNLTSPGTLDALGGPNSAYTKWLHYKQQLIEAFRLNRTTHPELAKQLVNDEPTSILPQKKSQRKRLLSLLGAKNSTATTIQPSTIEELLTDSELYPAGGEWQKPLITSVGHFFDRRFCRQVQQSDSQVGGGGGGGASGATDPHWRLKHLRNKNYERCLVVYWLDSRNKHVHLGSLQFNGSSRIESLQTKFDPNGTLKSSGHLLDDNQTSGDRRLIKLQELPPIDLCAKAGVGRNSCHVFSVTIDKQSLKLYATLSLPGENKHHDDQHYGQASATSDRHHRRIGNRILSAQLELTTTAFDQQNVVILSHVSLMKSDDLFRASSSPSSSVSSSKLSGGGGSSNGNHVNMLKNLVSATSPFQQTNLLYMDNGTPGQSAKIHSLNLGTLASVNQPSKMINNEEPINVHQTTLLDAQWETAKMKVKRQNSNKLNETFSVISWALDQASCSLCWLTSDNELYSSQLGQNDHNLETKFIGKLVPTRPLIRMPITAMQLFHNTLFFVDSTKRSLMAHKLPAAQSDNNDFLSLHNRLNMHSGGVKDERVPKLQSTHQVLLVEISPILDFSLIDLDDRIVSRPRRSHIGHSNSCYGLSELLKKKQETNRNFLERSRDNLVPTFHVSTTTTITTTTDVALVANDIDLGYNDDVAGVEPTFEAYESRSLQSSHSSSAQENYISYEKIDSGANYRDLLHLAFVICLLAVIASLACFNYFFWMQKCNMLAPVLMTTNSDK